MSETVQIIAEGEGRPVAERLVTILAGHDLAARARSPDDAATDGSARTVLIWSGEAADQPRMNACAQRLLAAWNGNDLRVVALAGATPPLGFRDLADHVETPSAVALAEVARGLALWAQPGVRPSPGPPPPTNRGRWIAALLTLFAVTVVTVSSMWSPQVPEPIRTDRPRVATPAPRLDPAEMTPETPEPSRVPDDGEFSEASEADPDATLGSRPLCLGTPAECRRSIRAARLRDYIRAYDAPDCTYLEPRAGEVVFALAAEIAPLLAFDAALREALGVEAQIALTLVEPAQCPAVDLARARGATSIPVVAEAAWRDGAALLQARLEFAPDETLLFAIAPTGSVHELTRVRHVEGAGALFQTSVSGAADEGVLLIAAIAPNPGDHSALADLRDASALPDTVAGLGGLQAIGLDAIALREFVRPATLQERERVADRDPEAASAMAGSRNEAGSEARAIMIAAVLIVLLAGAGALIVIKRRRAVSPAAPTAGINPEPQGHDVFVSYSRADRELVDRLAKEIEAAGFRVWLDRTSAGQDGRFAGRIVRALRGSRVIAVMGSARAFSSDHVVRELYIAGSCRKPFVLVRLDETEEPDDFQYFLSGFPRLPETGAPPPSIRGFAAAFGSVCPREDPASATTA